MAEKSQLKVGNPVLVSMAAFVVIVAGLRAAHVIVVPCLLAAFLTLICLPPLRWFQRRGFPTWMALLAITGIVVVIGLGIIGVVGSSISELRLQLPQYQRRVAVLEADLAKWLKEHHIDVGIELDREGFDVNRVLSLFGNVLGALGSVLNNAFVIVFMLVFMLLEAADLPAKLRAIAPGSSDAADRLARIQDSVWQYVRLKTRISLLTGGLVIGWLWLLGVDFPLLWGLLAFLLNFVPNIGSFLAAVPAVLVAILQADANGQPPQLAESLSLAAYTALGYVLINVIIGNVVEPRLMGTGVGLSTLVVFVSLVFWGWVLGPVGMVLSVPLTMIVKIVLDNSDELQWVAILLGSDVPAELSKKAAGTRGS
jgi:predicted PurR-regulated permease PerM